MSLELEGNKKREVTNELELIVVLTACANFILAPLE